MPKGNEDYSKKRLGREAYAYQQEREGKHDARVDACIERLQNQQRNKLKAKKAKRKQAKRDGRSS